MNNEHNLLELLHKYFKIIFNIFIIFTIQMNIKKIIILMTIVNKLDNR